MHLAYDVQVALAIATGVVVLGLQCLQLWRQIVNGRHIRRNTIAVDAVQHVVDDEIRVEIGRLKTTAAHLERLIGARGQRQNYGRRSTDRPPPPEEFHPPQVGPIPDPRHAEP